MSIRSLLLLALFALPLPAAAGDSDEVGDDPPAEEAPNDDAPDGDTEKEEPPANEPTDGEAPAEAASTEGEAASTEPVDGGPAEEPAAAPPEPTPAPEPPPVQDPPPTAKKATPPPAPVFSAMVQERARVEFVSNKDFTGNPDGKMKIGNRARAGLGMTLGPVKVFAQVQDVRTWGSEVNAGNGGEGTLFDYNANNFDLHQGYGELRTSYGLMLRIGRQEVNWHGQRLIGAVGWTDQARSFDGARLVYEGEKVGAEVFYALLLDRPTSPADTSLPLQDQHLVAFRGGPRVGKAFELDAIGIIRIDNLLPQRLATVGAHATGVIGPFAYEAEGYFQGGTSGTVPVAAGLIGVRAGATLVPEAGLYIGGGFDLVTGDENATDNLNRSFDTLYATNHKFYGHFDRYLNLPVHTGGEGLIDGLVRVKIGPKSKVVIKNDVHFFGSAAAPAGTDGFHGVEWDLDATIKIVRGFSVGAGVWTYFPGQRGGTGATPEFGAYAMTNFVLK